MSGRVTDDGLSEVIGFILIIGLLVVVASLYLTYMVPAQGREDEIGHMDYIKQQFLDYKISTDSLWINNAIGTSISQSIKLGTGGEDTTGSFAGFGILQPVGSGGSIQVNSPERRERVSIQAAGVLEQNNDYLYVDVNPIPRIDYINPSSVRAGPSADVPINIIGEGFSDNCVVYWNGIILPAGSVNRPTTSLIQITIGSSDKVLSKPGYATIYVENPPDGGGKSNVVSFSVLKSTDSLIPVITDVTGDWPALTISGEGGGDIRLINGSEAVGIPPSVRGVSALSLYRPSSNGGGTSNSWPIQFTDAANSIPIITRITPNPIQLTNPGPLIINIIGDGFDILDLNMRVQINGTSYIPTIISRREMQITILNPSNVLSKGYYQVAIIKSNYNSVDQVIFQSPIPIPAGPTVLDQVNSSLSHFYIYVTIPPGQITEGFIQDISLDDLNMRLQPYGVNFTEKLNNFNISVLVVPKLLSKTFRATQLPDKTINWSETFTSRYNLIFSSDLRLSIIKDNEPIYDNLTIASNIKNGETYAVDLQNYGIFSNIRYPLKINPVERKPTNIYNQNTAYSIKLTRGITLSNPDDFGVGLSNIPQGVSETIYANTNSIGALEYTSSNKYYGVQQNFIYQLGGVYVSQPFGGKSSLVLPSIAIAKNPTNNAVLDVKVADIQVRGPGDAIGGSSGVQITTTAQSISSPDIVKEGVNAKTVVIQIDPMSSDNSDFWVTAFRGIKETAKAQGIPDTWIDVENNPPRMIITGDKTVTTQDIHLDLTNVGFEVDLQAVGKAISTS